jgi:tetratricopeptide (TPR) repeat protein
MLNRRECTDFPLYVQVTEAIYKQNPDADAAYRLHNMFFRRKDFGKSEVYLREAISKTDNIEDKADYFLRMAHMEMGKENYSQMKVYALEALKLNAKLGEAYLYIGRAYAYAAKSYSTEDFEQRSVYWAAVDKFNRAKQVDPSLTEEANKLIGSYTPNFPSKDDGFFLGIYEDNEVKIGGWINETTKARYNK